MIFVVINDIKNAKLCIDFYHLKKTFEIKKFQTFQNDTITLSVCGHGFLAAAVCAGYIMEKYCFGLRDVILHIGPCYSTNNKGIPEEICVVNKIHVWENHKCFYPDILYRHTCQEIAVTTFLGEEKGLPNLGTADQEDMDTFFFDFDSAYFFASASYFCSPHQIALLRIVLNEGQKETYFGEALQKDIASLDTFIQSFGNSISPAILTKSETDMLTVISGNLHFSAAMKSGLLHMAKGYKLAGGDLSFLQAHTHIRGNKKEGKAYYERLQKLFSPIC